MNLDPKLKELEQQMFLESEARLDSVVRFKDTSEFPWKRDVQGNPIERKKSKAKCSVCKQDVYGNVDPTKIITCGLCVQKLLMTPKELKIQIKETFLQRGDLEAARSIESFIVPEDKAVEATFKRTLVLRRSKHSLMGSKPLPRMVKQGR